MGVIVLNDIIEIKGATVDLPEGLGTDADIELVAPVANIETDIIDPTAEDALTVDLTVMTLMIPEIDVGVKVGGIPAVHPGNIDAEIARDP